MVPLLVRGLRHDNTTAIKRKASVIIENMAKLVDNPLDAVPFLPNLLPGLEKVANEVSSSSSRNSWELQGAQPEHNIGWCLMAVLASCWHAVVLHALQLLDESYSLPSIAVVSMVDVVHPVYHPFAGDHQPYQSSHSRALPSVTGVLHVEDVWYRGQSPTVGAALAWLVTCCVYDMCAAEEGRGIAGLCKTCLLNSTCSMLLVGAHCVVLLLPAPCIVKLLCTLQKGTHEGLHVGPTVVPCHCWDAN